MRSLVRGSLERTQCSPGFEPPYQPLRKRVSVTACASGPSIQSTSTRRGSSQFGGRGSSHGVFSSGEPRVTVITLNLSASVNVLTPFMPSMSTCSTCGARRLPADTASTGKSSGPRSVWAVSRFASDSFNTNGNTFSQSCTVAIGNAGSAREAWSQNVTPPFELFLVASSLGSACIRSSPWWVVDFAPTLSVGRHQDDRSHLKST
jgi:hypothetical protein